jgi:hypothetical protein
MDKQNETTKKDSTECSQDTLRSFARILTQGRGKKKIKLQKLISEKGNIKVPSTTAIFNMSSATDCPSRKLGLCKAAKKGVKCYALKAEASFHPDVLPYRRRQEAYWKSITANDFVTQFLLINALKGKPFNSVRFNEAGDFHSQECLDKAEAIANMLSRFGITCYCYTSRSDLSFKKVKHLIVSGSGFSKKGITNNFWIIKDVEERPKGFGTCPMNCRTCNRCLIRGRNTVVMAH